MPPLPWRVSASPRPASLQMRRRDHHAAGGDVLGDDAAEFGFRLRIERRRRLVEQPDRSLDGEEPRDRDAALLPGRKIGRRQIDEMRRAAPRSSASIGARPLSPPVRRQKTMFSRTVMRRLQPVAMAEIMHRDAARTVGLGVERDLALGLPAGDRR